MQLYLIATLGVNAHLELDSFIAPKENLSYRTNSTKKPLQMLTDAGMLHVETLRLQQGEFKMALRVARLTKLGREMCASFGWTVVESDWDRLIEHHQGEKPGGTHLSRDLLCHAGTGARLGHPDRP